MDKRWLIVKLGDAIPSVLARRGDYEDFFAEALGLDDDDAYDVWDPRGGAAPPRIEGVRAIVITGSGSMVTDRADWSEATGAWLTRAAKEDVPILGICYGHQLLAHAFGGEVDWNPAGRELGTIRVELAKAVDDDPLFAPFTGRTLVMQASHRQHVHRLPEGAVLLGSSRHDAHQAFRLGKTVYGVQFHPELDDDAIRDYIVERVAACRAEGINPDALLHEVMESDDGRALLARFRAIVEA